MVQEAAEKEGEVDSLSNNDNLTKIKTPEEMDVDAPVPDDNQSQPLENPVPSEHLETKMVRNFESSGELEKEQTGESVK